jgi:hypothetical protein
MSEDSRCNTGCCQSCIGTLVKKEVFDDADKAIEQALDIWLNHPGSNEHMGCLTCQIQYALSERNIKYMSIHFEIS